MPRRAHPHQGLSKEALRMSWRYGLTKSSFLIHPVYLSVLPHLCWVISLSQPYGLPISVLGYSEYGCS